MKQIKFSTPIFYQKQYLSNSSKYGERVLRYRLRLNFYFRFHLFIYFLRVCVCVCLAVYDKLINIKRKTTKMSMTEPQHIRHNQINPRQVT